jgi:hypothetical protein
VAAEFGDQRDYPSGAVRVTSRPDSLPLESLASSPLAPPGMSITSAAMHTPNSGLKGSPKLAMVSDC